MGIKKIRLHEKRAVEIANESVFLKALLNALPKHSSTSDDIRSGQSGYRTVDEHRHVKLSLHSNSHN